MSENFAENNTSPQPESAQPIVAADQNERTLGLACHLSLFASFIIPFGSLLVALIIWLMKRESSKFIDETGKEVLNFQITLFLAAIACAILTVVLIGALLGIALFIASIVVAVMGAVAASKGEIYRYPYILRLIK